METDLFIMIGLDWIGCMDRNSIDFEARKSAVFVFVVVCVCV